MIAIVLSAVVSMLMAGLCWLLLGSRLPLHQDPRQNDVYNLAAYMAILFFPVGAVVLVYIAG